MGNTTSDLTENILDKENAAVSDSADNHESNEGKYLIDGDWTLDDLETYGPMAYIIANHQILKIVPWLSFYTKVNWYDWIR